MRLSEMTRPQLSRYARKLGLKPLKKWSDADLLNEIRAARRKRVAWPSEWSASNRRVYFQEIVGKPMPRDGAEAYSELIATIDAKIPELEVKLTETGPDCLGLFYEPEFFGCNEACPVMPLCKAACEKRPELVEKARALDNAATDVDALSDADVSEALASTTPAREAWYRWALDGWDDEIFDGMAYDEIKVMRWMYKIGHFSAVQAIKQFGRYFEEAEATTPDDLQRLVDAEVLKLADPPTEAPAAPKKAPRKVRKKTATKRAPRKARKA